MLKQLAKHKTEGCDGGKKVKGRKRHTVVDTLGNLLTVVVYADIHDTKSSIFAFTKALDTYPNMKAVSADTGYRKTFEEQVQEQFKLPAGISMKINGSSDYP